MSHTVMEQELINALKRAKDDYHTIERNEGAGSVDEWSKFTHGIDLALEALEIRASRRIGS